LKKAPKGAFFVHFDDPFCSKPPMSTRCLPAETPGAQGFAGFPERLPSTLPSTHFFAPIPETPAISAKIFEIFENVWGYDNPIEDGETIDGVADGQMCREIQWKCQYEDALIQPPRGVLDINMGNYASGGR